MVNNFCQQPHIYNFAFYYFCFVVLSFQNFFFFTMLLSLLISTLLICVSLSYVGTIYQVTPERILSQGYSRIVLPIYAFIFVICVVMLYHLTYCILYICKHIYQIVKNMRKVWQLGGAFTWNYVINVLDICFYIWIDNVIEHYCNNNL